MDRKQNIPKGWDKDAHSLWLAGDQQGAIQKTLAKLNAQGNGDPDTLLQAAYYFFGLHEYGPCAQILKAGVENFPDNMELRRNLAAALSRAQAHEDALPHALWVTQHAPDSYAAWDVLTACYYQLRQWPQAQHAGRQALATKHKLFGAPLDSWQPPAANPQELTVGKARAISFSLWGENPSYLRGGLQNILRAKTLTPDWQLRFYLDESVPQQFRDCLQELGATLIMGSAEAPLFEKLAWRFQVADDPTVGYFMVRDADSAISEREMLAVNEWLESDRLYHVIRDYWTHTDLILAGLWAGVACTLPSINEAMQGYIPEHMTTPNVDQWFLRDRIWPYVSQSVLVHDRCFAMGDARIPPGKIPKGTQHMGICEFNANREAQARELGHWLERAGI